MRNIATPSDQNEKIYSRSSGGVFAIVHYAGRGYFAVLQLR